MTYPGMGVMINELCGNDDSVRAFVSSVGKTIAATSVEDNMLKFTFTDGSKLHLVDDGQSCCENRYMVCDDNLADFIGAELISAETRSAPTASGAADYGDHEIEFLVVETSKGTITVANHNEHNGYYGGFSIRAHAG